MTENIKVAVRVRPFNSREKQRGTKLIIQMEGRTTSVINPENPRTTPHKFTYDHSYWSHDGYRETGKGYLEPSSKNYVDQVKLFKDLGVPMLENAWKGYNCSIFAYGQTGSGKSYSIVGHGANHGLVPRVCERLFQDIDGRSEPGIHYEVTFSMLEIYNEQIRDLLNASKTARNLTVREKPDKGFHVDGLTLRPVRSYDDIRLRMSEGERRRTIAATKMNETSSRAHTIVALHFAQNEMATKTTKHSIINLVDLAGSERVKQTEAVGDRFKEAQNINKSLLTLGNVLKALCDKAKGKTTNVPYRDSILTKLLKNALGGNSKTVMIAAIGPDAENYDQTLSTLRYADRAKSIKTVAQVNTAATDKLIQELIQERERLLLELQAKDSGVDPEELQRMKLEHENEIRRHKAQMVDMKKAWDDELERVRKEMEEMKAQEKREQEEEKKMPHLMNMNEDPALCNKLNHILKTGTSRLGNGKHNTNPDIVLNGPRIVSDHALMMNKGGRVFLEPKQGVVLHNGKEITASVQLHHQDRIRFGSNNLFVFINPGEAEELVRKGKVLRDITYEFAQDEIARYQGLNIENEDAVLQEEVMSIMQLVQDVNAMAGDMGKQVTFNIVLVSAEARGLEEGGRTEMYVRMYDLETQNEYLWDRNKFLVRQSHMQEMYNQFEESGIYTDVDKEKDPFWEPADTEVVIGVVTVPLNYIAHQVAFDEDPLTVIDYRARHIGFLKVEFVPCNTKGHEDDSLITEDPMDLVGKPLAFKVKIIQAMNLPERFTRSSCRYRFFNESTLERTQSVAGSNPHYRYERLLKLAGDQVTHKFVDYLLQRSLAIEILGQQADSPDPGNSADRSHRKQRESLQQRANRMMVAYVAKAVKRHDEKQKLMEEISQVRSKNEKLEGKLEKIAKIVGKRPKSAELKAILKILEE